MKRTSCYRNNGDYEISMKILANDEKAACLLNRSDEVKEVLVDFNLLLNAATINGQKRILNWTTSKNRDLWKHEEFKLDKSVMFIKIPPHSVKA